LIPVGFGLTLEAVRHAPAFLFKPLHAALLCGIAAATLVYHLSSQSIAPLRQIEAQELDAAIQRTAKSFFIAARSSKNSDAQKILAAALLNATRHPRVLSATVRSAKNEILSAAYKNNNTAALKDDELTLPLLDETDHVVGQIIFELSKSENAAVSQARRATALWMSVAFLLAGWAGYAAARRPKAGHGSELLDFIKHIAAGRLDGKIPHLPEQPEISEALSTMVEALQDRDRMRNSLGRIMDPKIAEALIKEDPKLGGRTRQATILFCDIRNYTSLCEGMNSDELQEFLNEYWKGTVEIIMEQEGTIDKFHGDGVCVVFGAPYLHEDDPLRAVRTAWRLVGNVASLNERRAAQRKTPIQIGVGVHTGEVIAGHIGSERRMDYTVVGDVVNVAARIEQLNKKFGTTILISDGVYEKVENHVRVRTLTLAHLRGHKRPILIHALKEFHDVPIPAKNREEAA
jgi:class 3 adenylate cyclase